MTDASNTISFLHDETYAAPFDRRDLNHETMVFVGGRATQSLNGAWSFVVDPFDTGLRQQWFRDAGEPEEGRAVPWDYHPDDGMPIDNILK